MVSFVQAGAGVATISGSGTVSLAGCTAGNLIVVHLVIRGNSEDWSAFSNEVNVTDLTGIVNNLGGVVTGLGIGAGAASRHALFASRVTANGACSGDYSVGASGEDMFVRMYEFQGAALGQTVASVFENDVSTYNANNATGTTVSDIAVVTLGVDRLACQLVALAANQAIGPFTGETGGDWVEAVPEFGSATGATATLQLQTAPMVAAGTIDGGTLTISSADWGCIGFGLISAPPTSGIPATRRPRMRSRGTTW